MTGRHFGPEAASRPMLLNTSIVSYIVLSRSSQPFSRVSIRSCASLQICWSRRFLKPSSPAQRPGCLASAVSHRREGERDARVGRYNCVPGVTMMRAPVRQSAVVDKLGRTVVACSLPLAYCVKTY